MNTTDDTYAACRQALKDAHAKLPPEAMMALITAAEESDDRQHAADCLAARGFSIGHVTDGHTLSRDVLRVAWPVIYGVVVGAGE